MGNKQIKILVAEDDPFLSKVAGATLESKGYKVDKAITGKQAIKMLEKDGYSMVMLDLIMPEMDGFEVLEIVKKKNIKTPVVVFSNLSQDEDKKEALALGAKDFFVKSNITLDELVAAVEKYIK